MFRLELQSLQSTGERDKRKFEWAVIYLFINFPHFAHPKSNAFRKFLDRKSQLMYERPFYKRKCVFNSPDAIKTQKSPFILVVMSGLNKYRFGLRGAFTIFKHPTTKNTQLQKSQGVLVAEGD